MNNSSLLTHVVSWQLGPQNGEALERAFGIFHEYSLTFDFYKKNIALLYSIPEARRYLSLSLADMLGELLSSVQPWKLVCADW